MKTFTYKQFTKTLTNSTELENSNLYFFNFKNYENMLYDKEYELNCKLINTIDNTISSW